MTRTLRILETSSAALALLLTGQLVASCTFVSEIDVCERRGAPEHDLNQRTEGDQKLDPSALASIAGAGGFVVLTSTDASGRAEVRRARLDADGTSLPTCEMQGEPSLSPPSTETVSFDAAAVAFPPLAGDQGLVIHRETTADRQRLWAVTMSENGCANNFGAGSAVLVADPGPGVFLGFAHVVAVGQRRFVVSWNELRRPSPTSVDVRLLGRVIQLPMPITFLETRRAPAGEAAPLPPDGDFPSNHTLVAMGEGRFGLLWYESSVSRFRVRFVVLDDRFAVVAGPVQLAETVSSSLDAPTTLAGAFDGEQVLVTWVLPREGDAGLAFGAFLDASARVLRSERSPDGVPFRLGSLTSGTETDLAVTPIPGGGFLAAWTERDALGRSDSLGTGVRAIGFGADGDVLFANRACDRTDFPLALDFEGDQSRVALTTLGDGTILALYTNVGGRSDDRSGSGIRAVGLRRSDLFAQ